MLSRYRLRGVGNTFWKLGFDTGIIPRDWMLSVLQYSVTLLLYFTISYPCILLFQSEFCLSLQDRG